MAAPQIMEAQPLKAELARAPDKASGDGVGIAWPSEVEFAGR